jgi:alkanesulfonate monooxygenase SsuD/methylene tetrahydromethanopterin reductase-like flavin-dependent oxidoreductase (luciferase family)
MGQQRDFRLGVMFNRALPPEDLVPFAREVEQAGADDLWVVEDLTWAGSIASTATVLAATDRLRVGIGIAPAPFRNPALLAMELAALARLHPGRLAAGIGHGVQEWMTQVGAAADSPMALLEETVLAVKSLLRGERTSVHGRAVTIDDVTLVHPPRVVPPVLVGAIGPRTVRLAGRVADGSVLVEGLDPEDVGKDRALVEDGRKQAAQNAAPDTAEAPHEMVAFVYAHVAENEEAAAQVIGPVAEDSSGFLGKAPEQVFFAVGDAEQVARRLESIHRAGADTIVMHLVGDDLRGQARAVLSTFSD